MTTDPDITLPTFLAIAAAAFALILLVNLYLYVPGDAIASAIGTMIGTYLFGLFVYWVLQLALRKDKLRRRFIVSIIGGLGIAATIYQQLSSVVVAVPSLWHQSFTVVERQLADFRLWSGFGTFHLHTLYAQLKEYL
jgi:glucose uptake protein GlcU